jgi:glycosyltransferase involved in cell wall biosynthesis
MNLVFVDLIKWDYNIATPYERPLGGSQSALCYLAVELARQGHRVTLLSGTSQPGQHLGVDCLCASSTDVAFLAQPFDAVVVLNGPAEECLRLRRYLAPATPLVLWTQHAHFQPEIRALCQPDVRSAWDTIICVSEWHRARLVEQFGLDPARTFVLRNAIGPAFEALFRSNDELIRAKAGKAALAYTSTPFRGLHLLLPVFDELRKVFLEAELDVYSSMKVYQEEESGDPFKELYDRCRSTRGVRYVGSVPQPALAAALKPASIFAYPNTFAETSCIAVLEAMAAGLMVVTSDLGALSETTQGFGALVAPASGPDDMLEFARRYLARLLEVLREQAQDPPGFAARRAAQVETINARYTWRVRAGEWVDAIASLKRAA